MGCEASVTLRPASGFNRAAVWVAICPLKQEPDRNARDCLMVVQSEKLVRTGVYVLTLLPTVYVR